MVGLVEILSGNGQSEVSSGSKGSSPSKSALEKACASKTELNRLKKEKEEAQATLESEKAKLEAEIASQESNLKSNPEYSKGVFRDKGDVQKKTESEIIKLKANLEKNNQKLKDHKTKSQEEIKAKEEAHEANVKAAFDAVKSEKNLQDTHPLAAHQAAYIGDEALFNKVNSTVALDHTIASKDTPLHAAVLGGNQAIILKLAENGADFGARNIDGQTPIHLAAQNPNHNVKTWGEWAKGKEASHRDIDNIIEVIPELSPALDIPDDKGKTALHYAAERGDLKTVEVLVKKGADPNVIDNEGKTPLAYVPEKSSEVKQALESAKTKYSERISEIANFDQTKTVRDHLEKELKGKKQVLVTTKDSITKTKEEIKETEATLALIKKKQGYIDSIGKLKEQSDKIKVNEDEVKVEDKNTLQDQLKNTEEPALVAAKKKVKEKENEIKTLPKEIEAAQKRIDQKNEYESQITELKTKIDTTERNNSIDKDKRDKAVSNLQVKLFELKQKRDVIQDTPATKAELEAKLNTLKQDNDQEGSLAQAQKQQREAQEAIDLTNKKLEAIKQKEKLEAEITKLEEKVENDKYKDVNVDDKTKLEGQLITLKGGEEVDGSLKKLEYNQRVLDGEINTQQKKLDEQNKEIDRIGKIVDASPDLEDKAKEKEFHAALVAGNRGRISEILSEAAKEEEGLKKYNVADNAGRPPLSYAMEKGLQDEMRMISEPLSEEYRTAQEAHSLQKGKVEVVQLELDDAKKNLETARGFSVQTRSLNPNATGSTEEDLQTYIDDITRIEAEKAKEVLKLQENQEKLDAATNTFNPKDKNGKTPLDYAIAAGNADGADLYGHTELHMKAGKAKGFDDREVNITDANKDAQNINGETPLHVAAKAGNKEMANELLAEDVNLSLQDRDGKTPLHVATEHGNIEIVEALVAKDPKLLQAQGKDGKTPVDIAIEQGKVEVLEKIKEVPESEITDQQLEYARTKRKELEEQKAKEEETKRKEQEQTNSGKSGLSEEEKSKMAGNAPAKDSQQQQQSGSTAQNPQDNQGNVWKEENFKNENGVKTCTIGDTSQGHFKQTRTADGKFEYEVQNTGNDEPDRIQVLKVPREGANPKSYDIVKFDRDGNVVDYQEGQGGKSKIGPETMKKINTHEESLSRAEVSSEKAKPAANKAPEKKNPQQYTPPTPEGVTDEDIKKKANLINDIKKRPSIRESLEEKQKASGNAYTSAINPEHQKKKQEEKAVSH